MIKKKKLIVRELVDRTLMKDKDIYLDWKIYQLVLFNLVQNAVKYNKECGHITIEMEL